MRRTLPMAAATALASASLATAENAATSPTVVTLGFDDGTADHVTTVRPLLDTYGFKATFFVNSGRIGSDRGPYMSWQDLRTLQADGQEVGGHTVNHTNLTTSATPPSAMQTELVAAAAGVAGIEYLVNGRVVARRTAAPYALVWKARSRRARAARLSVRVTDRLGRVARVPVVTVRVAGRH